MSFFYNSSKGDGKGKPAPKKPGRGVIPIESLRKLGCSVCSLDKAQIKSPKMKPEGPEDAMVYMLGNKPTEQDDEFDGHWMDAVGTELYDRFGKRWMSTYRSNYITQCLGPQTNVEIECCRGRIVADIELVKPVIVVTVGDAALHWATGISGSAVNHRGTIIAARIGKHDCWVYPVMEPLYVLKRGFNGRSEHKLALEHDVEAIRKATTALNPPKVYQAPYDGGIELITGHEPGDMQKLALALTRLAAVPHTAIDIETNCLRPYMHPDPKLYMVAVGTFEHTVAFPLDHPDGWGTDARRAQAWRYFGEYLLSSGRKEAHNVGFELEWLCYFFGRDLLRRTEWDDTQAMGHTFDERKGTKSLGTQTHIHFGFNLKNQSRVDVARLLEYPLKEVLRYNAMDTKWTNLLARKQRKRLEESPKYLAEYDRKVRLAVTLVLTETIGLPVSFKTANKLNDSITDEVSSIESRIARTPEVKKYSRQFGVFSPTNSDHVLRLYKDVCEREEVRRIDTRSGVVSWTSDEEALGQIPDNELPSAKLILEHRGLSKLLSTYVKPIIDRKIVCPDNMVRPKYSSMTAETGRLAAEDPNVQNWPKRKHREIRDIIAALPGHLLLACDYGQIEFRVVGMASEDRNLVKYCWTGYDVHKYWAERIVAEYPPIKDYIVQAFEVDWDEKGLKTLRQEAKNGWVFPQLFGSSVAGCAESLHIPMEVAQDLANEFWDEFSGVKKWQDRLMQSYEKNLYVETLGGRRRRGAMTKNQIINHPIQGTAADIVLEAMSAISERSDIEQDLELHPVLNVHDDLTFHMRIESLDKRLPIIVEEMCKHRFDYINVPLVVEASTGPTWNQLKEIAVYKSPQIFPEIINPSE